MRNDRTKRDSVKFWWPYAASIFGGSLGAFHILYSSLAGKAFDLGVLGFATLFVTSGNAVLAAAERRSAGSAEPGAEPDPGGGELDAGA